MLLLCTMKMARLSHRNDWYKALRIKKRLNESSLVLVTDGITKWWWDYKDVVIIKNK